MEGLELLLSSVSEHHSRSTVTSGTLTHSGFSKLLIQNLHKQQQARQFCDVAIRLANNHILHAHACILAAQSPYIAMYVISYANDHRTEGSSHFQHIDLSDVKIDIFEVLLKYFYTGALSLTLDQVGDIYHTAIMLQIDPIKELCIDFLKQNITIANHFEIFHLAQSLNIVTVVKAVVQFVITNFSLIERPIVFREFSYSDLVYALRACNKDQSPELEARKLNIVFRWLCHKPSDRIPVYTTAIESIDYQLIKREQFINLLYEKTCQEHDLHQNALVQNIVTYAKFSDDRHKGGFSENVVNSEDITESYLQSLEDASNGGDSSDTQDNLAVLEDFHLYFENEVETQRKLEQAKKSVENNKKVGDKNDESEEKHETEEGSPQEQNEIVTAEEQKQTFNNELNLQSDKDKVTENIKQIEMEKPLLKSKECNVKLKRGKKNIDSLSKVRRKSPKQNKENLKCDSEENPVQEVEAEVHTENVDQFLYPDRVEELLEEAPKVREEVLAEDEGVKNDADKEFLLMNWSCSSEDSMVKTLEKMDKITKIKVNKGKKKTTREPTVRGEYKCMKCPKVFWTQCSLKHHMLGHGSDEPYLCEICGFSTRHIGSMAVHKKQHTGNKFKCSFPGCSYETVRKERIVSHTNFHKGIKEFECRICGKTFTGKKHLGRHEKTHDPQKRFCCSECDYGSNRQDKYRDHVRKHHQDKAIEVGFLTVEEIQQGTAPKAGKKRRTTAISPKRDSKNAKVNKLKSQLNSGGNTEQTMTMPVFLFAPTSIQTSQQLTQTYQALVSSTVQQPVTLDHPLVSLSNCLTQSEAIPESHDVRNVRSEALPVSHDAVVSQSQFNASFPSAASTDTDDVLSYLTSAITNTADNTATQQNQTWTFNGFT